VLLYSPFFLVKIPAMVDVPYFHHIRRHCDWFKKNQFI
jgi:hypothetical protein